MLFVLGVDVLDVFEQIYISFGDCFDIMVVMWFCKLYIICYVVYGIFVENMIYYFISYILILNLDSWNVLKIIYRVEFKVCYVDVLLNDDW